MTRTSEQIYDELLVLRCQDGEGAALEELVRRWQPRLLRHAQRLTDDLDTASDVLQEAWIAMVRGIGKLDDPARFPAWAYRIVTHKCADWTRRTTRQRRMKDEVSHQPMATSAPPQVERDEETHRVQQAIALLPQDRQSLLALFYLQGLGVAEIAKHLGIPRGTVKSRLFHARNALKQTLEGSS